MYVNSPGVIPKSPDQVKGEGGTQEITLNHKEEEVNEKKHISHKVKILKQRKKFKPENYI